VENKCLSFEDMMDLLTADRITDENRMHLFYINGHLVQCDSCRASYQKISKLYDVVETWSIEGQYETEQRLQNMKASLALIKAQKTAPQAIASRIDNWIKNHVFSSAKIILGVSGSIKMAVDDACAFINKKASMDFRYGALEASRSLTDEESKDLNLLIDKNHASNRVRIEGNRKICLTLTNVSGTAPLVAIIPDDTTQAAIMAELTFEREKNCWIAEIDILQDGEYDLLIEAP